MSDAAPIRALEWFAGLGGFSAAIDQRLIVVGAIDISQPSQRAYQLNYSAPFLVKTIESLSAEYVNDLGADFWWLSPPCQPFTKQGLRRDWDDPRTAALRHLIDLIPQLKPTFIAMENVPLFHGSVTHGKLISTLRFQGYTVREWELCPSQFGLPNRRLRYYLAATHHREMSGKRAPVPEKKTLGEVLATGGQTQMHCDPDEDWLVPEEWQQAYGEALHVVDRHDPQAITRCFTAAYGRSPSRSGSYLATEQGPRFFRPDEILKLLGFPAHYQLPRELSRQQAWHLTGNSLAIPPVQLVISSLLEG